MRNMELYNITFSYQIMTRDNYWVLDRLTLLTTVLTEQNKQANDQTNTIMSILLLYELILYLLRPSSSETRSTTPEIFICMVAISSSNLITSL